MGCCKEKNEKRRRKKDKRGMELVHAGQILYEKQRKQKSSLRGGKIPPKPDGLEAPETRRWPSFAPSFSQDYGCWLLFPTRRKNATFLLIMRANEAGWRHVVCLNIENPLLHFSRWFLLFFFARVSPSPAASQDRRIDLPVLGKGCILRLAELALVHWKRHLLVHRTHVHGVLPFVFVPALDG